MQQPRPIDNITTRLADELKESITAGRRLSKSAVSFYIYAFQELKTELESIKEQRFVFTSPTFTAPSEAKEEREFFIPGLNRERKLYGTDFETKLRNRLSQKAMDKECAAWIGKKVRFRSNSSQEQPNGFFVLQNETQRIYQPFNNFDTTQPCCGRGNTIRNFVNVAEVCFDV